MRSYRQVGALTAATLALLLLSVPARAQQAQFGQSYVDRFGILFPVAGQRGPTWSKYLYSPVVGAFTVGPDPNFEGLNPIETAVRQSQLPKGDPSFQGVPIPYISGPILPIDQNRLQIDEGMGSAAPEAFKEYNRANPWYSSPDAKLCSAEFKNAWTYTADVIAPEVTAVRVRLPHDKTPGDAFVIGAAKRNFPVLVGSAYGQILLRNGAKALISRAPDALRVFNLTGGKDSVLVKFPTGGILSLGTGNELVVASSKDAFAAPLSDGIARRGASPVFPVGKAFVAINEFSSPSVLQSTGIACSLARKENLQEKQICETVIKTAAALAMVRGGQGFRADGNALVARKVSNVTTPKAGLEAAKNTSGARTAKPTHVSHKLSLSNILRAKKEVPPPAASASEPGESEQIDVPAPSLRQAMIRRCKTAINAPLKHLPSLGSVPGKKAAQL